MQIQILLDSECFKTRWIWVKRTYFGLIQMMWGHSSNNFWKEQDSLDNLINDKVFVEQPDHTWSIKYGSDISKNCTNGTLSDVYYTAVMLLKYIYIYIFGAYPGCMSRKKWKSNMLDILMDNPAETAFLLRNLQNILKEIIYCSLLNKTRRPSYAGPKFQSSYSHLNFH